MINLNYFKEVADDDPEAYTDLLQLILKQQAESFKELDLACQNNNLKLVEITAHKMKAIVAIMGLMDQRQLLAELEEAAQGNQPSTKISRLIQDSYYLWQYSAQELQSELTAKIKN